MMLQGPAGRVAAPFSVRPSLPLPWPAVYLSQPEQACSRAPLQHLVPCAAATISRACGPACSLPCLCHCPSPQSHPSSRVNSFASCLVPSTHLTLCIRRLIPALCLHLTDVVCCYRTQRTMQCGIHHAGAAGSPRSLICTHKQCQQARQCGAQYQVSLGEG